MEKNKQLLISIILSALLLIIGHIFPFLSLLHLVALVPIILLLKNNNDVYPLRNWLLPLGLVIIFYQLLIPLNSNEPFSLQFLLYAIGVAIATSLYGLVKASLNTRLGLFIVIIFWLGFEYLALTLNPHLGNHFLFKTLAESSGANFGAGAGFLAFSLWGLSANFIFAFVLFDATNKYLIKLRWLSLAYATIAILAPIWLNYFIEIGGTANSWQLMMEKYAFHTLSETTYDLRGEWLGKTTMWLSVLILIYALVKRKVKR